MNAPEAPFEAPWQAQIFALTVALNEAGHLPWSDWTAAFGPRVQDAGPEDYWRIWAETLADLTEARGLASPGQIDRLAHDLQVARTPEN